MALPRLRTSRYRRRSVPGARLVWGGLLRVLQRVTHYKRGDKLEFRLSFSVRELVTEKSRAVLDQVEALVQAVQKAGSYEAREEAVRAVHAVLDGLKGRVPPDVWSRLTEAAPVREAARLGRATVQRFQKESQVTSSVESNQDLAHNDQDLAHNARALGCQSAGAPDLGNPDKSAVN